MHVYIYLNLLQLLSFYWWDADPFILIYWLYYCVFRLDAWCSFPKQTWEQSVLTLCPQKLGQHLLLPPSSAWVAENYRRVSMEGGSEGHPLFLLKKGKTPADKLEWVFFFFGGGEILLNVCGRKIMGMWPSILPVSQSFRNVLLLKSKRWPCYSWG